MQCASSLVVKNCLFESMGFSQKCINTSLSLQYLCMCSNLLDIFHEFLMKWQIINAHLYNTDIMNSYGVHLYYQASWCTCLTKHHDAPVLPSIMMHLSYQASWCACLTKHHDASVLPSVINAYVLPSTVMHLCYQELCVSKHHYAYVLPSIMMHLYYQASWCICVTKHHDAFVLPSRMMLLCYQTSWCTWITRHHDI